MTVLIMDIGMHAVTHQQRLPPLTAQPPAVAAVAAALLALHVCAALDLHAVYACRHAGATSTMLRV